MLKVTLESVDRASILIPVSDCSAWSGILVEWGDCDDSDGMGSGGLVEEWDGSNAAAGGAGPGGETGGLLWTRVDDWEPMLQTWRGNLVPSTPFCFCNVKRIQWEAIQKTRTKKPSAPPMIPPKLLPDKPVLLWKEY